MRKAFLRPFVFGLFAFAGPLLAESLLAAEPIAAVSSEELRPAIEKSLPLLLKGAIGHRENRTCFACHNQGIPLLALTAASECGFTVDKVEIARQRAFIGRFLNTNRERYHEGKGQGGQVDTAGYALLTLAALGWEPDSTTSAVTEYLLRHQSDQPHWRTTSQRPPSEASPFTTNYLAVAGLQRFASSEQHERAVARIAQVREWALQAKPADNEDRVFRLWLLHSAGAEQSAIDAAADELVSHQRLDGGWSQLGSGEPPAAVESDAYATSSALVALSQAAGRCTCEEAYQRGLRYLLTTQLPDGSWHVRSRSKPFQTYFETGFPHGNDQFISAAASAWATWAMALACESVADGPAAQAAE